MHKHARSLSQKATDVQFEQDFSLILMSLNTRLTDLGFEVSLFDDLKAEDVLQEIYKGRRLCFGYV